MSGAKKFLLIDSSNVDRVAGLLRGKTSESVITRESQAKRLEPLVTKEIRRLDNEMLNIINDATLTEQEKVSRYNEALADFRMLTSKGSASSVKAKELTKKEEESKINPLLEISKQ